MALRIWINKNEEGNNNPDWEILTRIFRHIKHAIKLHIIFGYIEGAKEMRAFAQAIQGYPAITRFYTHDGNGSFRFESTGILCSALATLPNLEFVSLRHVPLDREEVPGLGRPESMTELLRAPSLRSIQFNCFCFTDALCEATANALEERTVIATLNLSNCSFLEGGCWE
jgi:hypothetical protein